MSGGNEARRMLRSLGRQRTFALTAVGSLALGIGANATVFSIVSALLLRPLPFADPDRLAIVRAENPRLGVEHGGVTLEELAMVRAGAPALVGAAVVREDDMNLAGGDRPRRLRGAVVSSGLFGTIGVGPVLGGSFTASDDVRGAPRRVLVAHRLWQSALGGTSDVVGRTVRIDGDSYEIAGVMPPGFRFPEQSDVWLSVGATGSLARPAARAWRLYARLAPGADLAGARRQVAALARHADDERPAAQRGWALSLVNANQERGENARAAVLLLLALVTCVLLVACANLAGLLVARGITRGRDFAIRAALGASRARLLALQMSESVALAVSGGALALLLAAYGVRAVRLAFPADTLPFWLRFEMDWRVALYGVLLSCVTAVLFGLAPAWKASRQDVATVLGGGGRHSVGAMRHARTVGVLVAGQIAFAVVLLIAAAALGAALRSMQVTDLGYQPAGLLTAEVAPRGTRYETDDARRVLYAAVVERIAAVPGVRSVTGFEAWGGAGIEIAAGPAAGAASRADGSTLYMVMPAYFRTMGGRMAAGRELAAGDDARAPAVAVVNEEFARRNWPGQNAIGKSLRLGDTTRAREWMTVVGVAANVRRNPADPEIEAHVYAPVAQQTPRRLQLLIRTSDVAVAPRALESAVWSVDPGQPLGPVTTLYQSIARWTAPTRFFALSLMGFAAVAMVLALFGVYSVVAYTVGARTRELGIRVALGATPARIIRLVLGGGVKLAAYGAAIGLAVGIGVAGVLRTLPLGVERAHPSDVAGAAAALVLAAIAAAYAPARRASRIDPTVAFRHDT